MECYGLIQANFYARAETMKKMEDEIGSDIPFSLKEKVFKIILNEFDEEHYGGRWSHPSREGIAHRSSPGRPSHRRKQMFRKHLLIRAACRGRLEATEEYVAAIRSAGS